MPLPILNIALSLVLSCLYKQAGFDRIFKSFFGGFIEFKIALHLRLQTVANTTKKPNQKTYRKYIQNNTKPKLKTPQLKTVSSDAQQVGK